MLSLPFHRLTGLAGLTGMTAGPDADAPPTTSTSTSSTSTTTTRSLQLDERAQDWLDDKIQSDSDLAGLDELIAGMTAQSAQLEAQRTAAEDALAQAHTAASEAQTALADRISEFDALQRSLDSRMGALAADAPDAALAQLQAPVRRLRGLRLARGYLALLHDVHQWRAAVGAALGASKSTPPDVSAALAHSARLRRLAARLHQLQPAADDAAVHLASFVDAVAVAVADDVTAALTARLDGVLAVRRWPVGVDPDGPGVVVVDAEWRTCFEQLLDSQVPELLDRCVRDRSGGGGDGAGLETLLPMDAMAAVFAAEFRYHFLAANVTSQPDGLASHCYPWLLHTLDRWERFLRENFGPVLAARLADTAAAAYPAYVDPACALMTSLLPLVREKLAAVLPHAQAHPAFLAEFVPRLVAFEDQLRARCGFLAYPPPLPTSTSNPSRSPSITGADDAEDDDDDDDDDAEAAWPNLAAPVVDQCFAAWCAAQKAHALQRYRDIVAAPAGRELDADSSGSGNGHASSRSRPTVAAVQLTELLRAVTAVWTGLRRVGQLAALLDVQLTILDAFHDRLGDALDAVQAASSAVVRTLHGVAALPGAGVLAALCRVVGSADHVAVALGLWTNEPVFVALGRQMLLQHRRDDTAGPGPALAADTAAHGVFYESIRAFTRRRDAALDLLVGALADSHVKAFRVYLARPHWTTVAAVDDASDTGTLVHACSVSPELDEPLQVLQRNLAVVGPALGAAALRRTWRRALERLHELLWSEVLMRHRFSRAGAAQFRADLDALLALLDRALPAGAGRAALAGLAEALVLLTLPTDAPADAPTDAWTLRRVADRLFTDGAEARRVLEALGLATVSPANARNIVQRRIESSE